VTRWEYRFLRYETFKILEGQLRFAGAEGWEAVSFSVDPEASKIGEKDAGAVTADGIPGIRQVWVVLLKRPIIE
jgi:hypothetical protein